MRQILLLLILSLFAFGCKSIQKQKMKSAHVSETAMSSESLDSVFSSIEIGEAQKYEEESTELIEQTHIPFDSSGFTIFKPVTITTKTTKSVKTEERTQDSINASQTSASQNQTTDSSNRSKDLDKSSEGQEVVEQITEAIFPTWGKIVGSIFAVLAPVLWGMWKKRKEVE